VRVQSSYLSYAVFRALLAFLEEQRAEYTRSLPRRLEQVESLWQQILKGESLAEALPAFERHAHSIAGSAATFGWADLGLAAQALELAIEPHVSAGQPLAPETQAAVALAVEELQRRFRRAA
jgi:HPt (histidine-containing phosphotransfer) domain-containing protein